LGDSFYEYLLKQWIQATGKSSNMRHSSGPSDRYRRYYDEAVKSMKENMIGTVNNMTFLSEWKNGKMTGAMDHLVCCVACQSRCSHVHH
jgi:hypothetical protein